MDERRNFGKACEYVIGSFLVFGRIDEAPVGDGGHSHLRGFSGGDARKRVLNDETFVRRRADFLRYEHINLGIWLAALNFVSGDNHLKQTPNSGPLEKRT